MSRSEALKPCTRWRWGEDEPAIESHLRLCRCAVGGALDLSSRRHPRRNGQNLSRTPYTPLEVNLTPGWPISGHDLAGVDPRWSALSVSLRLLHE
jgi:hypothetical protein